MADSVRAAGVFPADRLYRVACGVPALEICRRDGRRRCAHGIRQRRNPSRTPEGQSGGLSGDHHHSGGRDSFRRISGGAVQHNQQPRPHRVPGPQMADGRRVRVQRRNPDGPADRRDACGRHRRQPDDPDILRRLHERRGQPRIFQVLRVHVAVHCVDGGPSAGVQRNPSVRVLGAGRPVLLPADRVLVQPPLGGECGEKGVHRDQDRRPWVPACHPLSVLQPGCAGSGGTQRTGHRGPVQGGRGGTDRGRRSHLDSRRDIRGSRGKVGAVPAAHLAAGRDGRSHAGERAYPRRDDGRSRSVSWWRGSSRCSRRRTR